MYPAESEDNQETNTIVVLATGKGKVAFDNVEEGKYKTGLYNTCLVEVLSDEKLICNVPITRIFELVAHRVMNHPKLGKIQRPWKTDSFECDKYLIYSFL
eukprot:TRINITY_DN8975_c0_g1_i1.p1 TRINITY_DN8975_c0_g1~~TRINITY_DN8975_c0_g1_i1.p1  ORF type:complete len:100 (+),score=5.13 TRINITY_DN8975_c0_g1_i1:138-437(+)